MIAQILTCMSVLGAWQYAGLRYDGNFYPNPNANLILTFSFYNDQTAQLIWKYLDDGKTCERKGIYELKDDVLYQKTTWVNPKNHRDCGKDPDMQLGKETVTPVKCEPGELGFRLELNGRELIYVLKLTPPPSL